MKLMSSEASFELHLNNFALSRKERYACCEPIKCKMSFAGRNNNAMLSIPY